MQRQLKATRGPPNHDHGIVAWLSSVNNPSCCVAEEYWSASLTSQGPHQSPAACAIQDAEACLRTLRGHFAPQFRRNRPFERRVFFNFCGAASRMPARLVFDACVVTSPRRVCERTHCHTFMQRGSEDFGEDDERNLGVEHSFNAILSCSSNDYYGVPWHDSMNCCGLKPPPRTTHLDTRLLVTLACVTLLASTTFTVMIFILVRYSAVLDSDNEIMMTERSQTETVS
ncbi:hypothetical protein MRX96_008013 [Rhipicephalus microplus]